MFLIHDIFDGWGTPQGDTIAAKNLAAAQCEYSRLKAELHGRMALGLDTIQTEEMMSLVFDYAETLRDEVALGPTLFDTCDSVEAYEAQLALILEARPSERVIDYKAIKQRIPLADYVGQHTQLKKRGDKYIGKCPLPDHKDDTASLHIYPDQSWYCFGCRRGGDLFHYVKARGTRIEDLG